MTPFNTSIPEPQDSPGLMLWHATNAWQRAIRAALEPHGITHVQFVLLAALAHSDAPLTQREAASATGSDPMMVSQVLRALEKKGLVTRAKHPSDGRAILLTLTAEGLARANRAVVDVGRTDAAFFSPLGVEVGAFARSLSRLAGERGTEEEHRARS